MIICTKHKKWPHRINTWLLSTVGIWMFNQRLLKITCIQLQVDFLFEFHPEWVFKLEVYYKVDRLLTGLTAKKGTTAWWNLNKPSLQ